MEHSKIKVAIIEDSRLYQAYLKKVLEQDEQIDVCLVAGTAREALAMIEADRPDVITLDINLPDVIGCELLTILVETYGIPIIVVTSIPSTCEEALKLGAKDFIVKASEAIGRTAEQFAMLLKLKIKMQASGFHGGKIRGSLAREPAEIVPETSAEARKPGRQIVPFKPGIKKSQKIIVIGASLGGTEATLEVLRNLPAYMPGILVVQHMPPGFTNAYAIRLNQNCAMHVKEAKNGDRVERGTVLIAKGGEHLSLYKAERGYRVRCFRPEHVTGFCPSVDHLFESAAQEVGSHAIGVILTGMGSDGAKGMVKLHDCGAHTIAQDEESCTVYGMPGAAVAAGAVDDILSLGEISRRLTELLYQEEKDCYGK